MRGFLVLGLLAMTFYPSPASGQFFFMENEAIGKPAPDFTLSTVDGKKMSFSQFRGTDKAIVFFWATWCPHCRKELGDLVLKKEEFTTKGIKIALVDVGEDEAAVKQYLQKNKVDFTVFLDEDSLAAQNYNLVGVPTFLFIDAKGIVRDLEYNLPPNYDEILSAPAQQ